MAEFRGSGVPDIVPHTFDTIYIMNILWVLSMTMQYVKEEVKRKKKEWIHGKI